MKKFVQYFPNNKKSRKFLSLPQAIEDSFKQLKNHQIIEIRSPDTKIHSAVLFGLKHTGSVYVMRSAGKNFVKCF